MAKYIVEVVMATCVAVKVEANSEEEAQELAYEKADPFTVDDWDYEVYTQLHELQEQEEE